MLSLEYCAYYKLYVENKISALSGTSDDIRTFVTTHANMRLVFCALLYCMHLYYNMIFLNNTYEALSISLIIQVGCMQVILSWHTKPQQLTWSTLTRLRVKARGAPSMNWDTTNREVAGNSHHTPQSVHATCGQCMCMKRCWGSTGQRWSTVFF